MNRYFLETSYIGTNYAGFQIQKNAISIQFEIEKALEVLLRRKISLTGSSRTDAGVHALQNYFHFDYSELISNDIVYNINAILPNDIVVNNLLAVKPESHCRFDAVARLYAYHIYRFKNPFLADRAYYYPYEVDIQGMQAAAELLYGYTDYTAFSKRRTQVQTYECSVFESSWKIEKEEMIYTVKANRFLRGMVRGLVGTMLHIGRGKMQLDQFRKIIEDKNSSLVDFSAPAKGLFLEEVIFAENYFDR
ncbi:MAG: tRNA pseudouridine(38-40) synthase TruA [Chitinophagaceae bacterium]|nr:tRNA pseudouridine(38-40) synthase TruA [Chitinophagaceae bacterium]